MGGFIEFPLELDEEELRAAALERIAAAFPGWQANEAHLEVALVEEITRLTLEAATLAVDVPRATFREFGLQLLDLPAIDGAPASALTTWVAVDTLGYTIPAGTVVAYRRAGDELWYFQTEDDVTISPGSTTATNVVIRALEDGDLYNGIATSTALELVDAITWVSTVTLSTATSGGVDAETDDAYLDRLAEQLTLLSRRPILADDFATLARNVEGVYRATAIDGYNPTDTTYNNERMVSVAAVDSAGANITAGLKTELADYLDENREINFVVHVIDPTYTNLAIVYAVQGDGSVEETTLEAEIDAALTAYISPANWGGGDLSPPQWALVTTVRYLELAAVINSVPGVDYVTTLTLNGGTANVTLTGVAPLPAAVGSGSTISGTVTNP